METPWSLDFCLVCDRQTLGGAYCSQACRLAEMDGTAAAAAASDSEPSSSATSTITTTLRNPWTSQNTETGAALLHFGSTIDFGGFKFPGSSAANYQIPSSTALEFQAASRPGLTPSSSQTSLSSLQSVSSTTSTRLSGQAKSELEAYFGSFDKVRDWKRRRTSS
ncbi:hypothetical protein PAAG_00307 [Paracoccidioides lutzii Pb01]|uniref:Life-span regulatory factor domain-containing protein n=1 Tax=Paracoccidioides lutzii (strain ATCC MYA-826 / Pb01) TaxID=502779 RepID=C1GP62_PARBA|nr:hypothetical protein PAAG_00307 [Paracoccidioides lutzii Pb01]EEH35984.2 hypothetical protein PAAG_00307 [Paracoccidioides lutzii Pb01]